MDVIRQLTTLMRPHQWIKNIFVFTGILFGHRWNDPQLAVHALVAAIAFSLMSSAVYIFNDLCDRESDRQHPKKKHRPLAAGTVTVFQAVTLAGVLTSLGITLAHSVSAWASGLILFYGLLNIAYSIRLKHVVILDVFCIAAGFMLRILVGTIGLGIPPSNWLLLCGLMITLFLGFAKRRAELITLQDKKGKHRAVLENYAPSLLDQIGAICATGVIITYSLYTTSPETIAIHNTGNLIFTVPFVMYGLFRYNFLVHKCYGGGEPSRDLLKDKHIVASVAAWALTTSALLL